VKPPQELTPSPVNCEVRSVPPIPSKPPQWMPTFSEWVVEVLKVTEMAVAELVAVDKCLDEHRAKGVTTR
jgi:hypothetical protein